MDDVRKKLNDRYDVWAKVIRDGEELFPRTARCERGVRCYDANGKNLEFISGVSQEIIIILGYVAGAYIVQRAGGTIVQCPMRNAREMFEVTAPL